MTCQKELRLNFVKGFKIKKYYFKTYVTFWLVLRQKEERNKKYKYRNEQLAFVIVDNKNINLMLHKGV